MMRVPARVVFHAASVSATAVVLLLAACSSSERPGGASTQVTPPGQQPGVTGEGDVGPSPSPSSGGACEDLGRLVGTSITAKLASTTARSVVLPLANRPVPSRLAVVAVGPSADLTGKTVALGAAQNANYETCTHCFVIALGCGTDCTSAAWFYPRSGTATFTAVPSAGGEPFKGTLTDVVLEEVKVDFATNVSTKVEGGACLHVQELAFDAVAESTSGVGQATDAGSSGGSDTDAGSSDGGTTSSGGTGKGGGGGDLGNLKAF